MENVTAASWFPGDEGRTHDEARFLARLRELAPGWAVAGLGPERTWCLTALVPLLVVVDCPLLAGEVGLTSLHVGYWPPTPHGLRLQGEWGDNHLLDNGGDDTDLEIQGISGEPESFADTAGIWLATQLLRPMERMEWVRGERVVAAKIRLIGGQTLVRRGSWLRTRREPDRTTRLN
ncbi:hypothetical protein [Phycicoccus sp. Soil802]|uniref:hypothetical protein n=1 Tax=Phycicoccus sp. Soil802 TaxID=1736414 RepID=UPI0012F8BD59|nr:hypothetical protein [Phycicoccus sp. Soil802]